MDILQNGAQGVLASFGGEFGGWSLFLKDDKLHYVHNYLKIKEYAVASAEPIATGKHTLRIHFVPTGRNLKPDHFSGDVILDVDGKKVGELKDIKSAASYCSMTGYGLVIGRNIGTPVSHQYEPPFTFTGDLEKVTINVK